MQHIAADYKVIQQVGKAVSAGEYDQNWKK